MDRRTLIRAALLLVLGAGLAASQGVYPPGSGGSSGTPPTLSNVALSASASTIAASWNTNIPADSNLLCGTVSGTYTLSAADAHAETGVTVHQAIVAGLAASTTYYCVAQSVAYGGGTGTSTPVSATTSAAAASTAISNFTAGSWSQVGNATTDGDTFYNAVCADGNTYTALDDTHGFGKTGSANMMLGKFTSESTFTGSNVNFLAGYGGFSTSWGSDAGGHTRSNKISGLLCMGGALYLAMGRQNQSSSSGYPDSGVAGLFNMRYGTILRSTDLGANWDSISAPTISTSYPYPPNPPTFISAFFADTAKFAASSFVQYGVDDGTLGYFSPTCDVAVAAVTASCRVDNADAYVYVLGNDGYWNNGSNLYLARISRARLKNLNAADIQYYTNALSDGNGLEDGNWSSSIAGITPVFTSAGQVGEPALEYIPYLNRYALLGWYYPNCNTGSSNAGCPINSTTGGNSIFNFYDAPHPWGPFTSVGTISSYQAATGSAYGSMTSASGLYNPTLLQRSAVTALASSPKMTVLAGGNFYSQSSWYTINYASLELNLSAPAAVTGFTATAAGNSAVNLAWTAPASFGVGYSVFRSLTSGFTPGSGNLIASNVSTTSYADSGLTAGTTYYYAVESTNSGGSSSAATANATTTTGFALDSICPGSTCPQAGAWSVARQLRTAYSGNLILIRRASDSTTQAVGNDGSGNVNQSTITTFCSGTTCGIDTIYDQSGTSFNLTTISTTVANECQIYQSGAIVTQGGKPACIMPGTSSQGYLAAGLGSVLNSLSAEVMEVATMSSGAVSFAELTTFSDGTHNEGGGTQGLGIGRSSTTNALALFHDNTGGTLSAPATPGTQFWLNLQYNNPSNTNKSTLQIGTSSNSLLMTGSATNLASTEVSVGYQPTSSASFWAGYFSEAYVWNVISGQATSLHASAQSYYGVP